jgi:hypothetical protein
MATVPRPTPQPLDHPELGATSVQIDRGARRAYSERGLLPAVPLPALADRLAELQAMAFQGCCTTDSRATVAW